MSGSEKALASLRLRIGYAVAVARSGRARHNSFRPTFHPQHTNLFSICFSGWNAERITFLWRGDVSARRSNSILRGLSKRERSCSFLGTSFAPKEVPYRPRPQAGTSPPRRRRTGRCKQNNKKAATQKTQRQKILNETFYSPTCTHITGLIVFVGQSTSCIP